MVRYGRREICSAAEGDEGPASRALIVLTYSYRGTMEVVDWPNTAVAAVVPVRLRNVAVGTDACLRRLFVR